MEIHGYVNIKCKYQWISWGIRGYPWWYRDRSWISINNRWQPSMCNIVHSCQDLKMNATFLKLISPSFNSAPMHLSHFEAGTAPAPCIAREICQLLGTCFPEGPPPAQLEDVLGFYDPACCHWIVLGEIGPAIPRRLAAGEPLPSCDKRFKVSGCICGVMLQEAVFIHALAVLPDMQGRGLGTMLLIEAQKLAVRSGKVLSRYGSFHVLKKVICVLKS